jgi:glycosyltransferase involved in cell wall biosynthesis
MNYPKISIVTPSYNQGQYIEDTILSVLGQFYPNLEYLIFDGGSNDNTVEIIKKYENHLTYWVSEKDKGQSNAINMGFTKSTGEILMWLNSDDILMPNILNYVAQKYREQGDGIFFGNCIHFRENLFVGLVTKGSNSISTFNTIPLEIMDTITQPSSFWSRKVWIENGMLNEDFHFGFDWEWFLRAKKNNICFFPLNKTLSIYRQHDAHKTGSGGEKRQQELLKIYNLYSHKYAILYEKIRMENFNFSLFKKIIHRICKIISRGKFNNAHMLKITKYKKYKGYSTKEMNTIQNML